MKRSRILLLVLVMLFLSGCSAGAKDLLHEIPPGYVSKEEHWDREGFQDYTDYCKYRYPSADHIAKLREYAAVTETDVDWIRGYFEDFRQWMEAGGRLSEYDFDDACITAGDYVRTEGAYEGATDYTVWFFDTGTLTLYRIHTNI